MASIGNIVRPVGPRGQGRIDGTRSLSVGALLMAALLLASIGMLSWRAWDAELARQFEALQTTAEVQSRAVEAQFDRHQRSLAKLRHEAFDADGRLRALPLAHAALRLAVQNEPDWAAAAVVAVDGRIALSSRAPPGTALPSESLSREGGFTAALEQLRRGVPMAIGRGRAAPVSGEWVVPLRYGVRDSQGQLTYVLIAAMPLTRPLVAWEGAAFAPGGGVGIMRAEGREVYLIARHPVPRELKPEQVFGMPRTGEVARLLLDDKLPPSGTYDGRSALTGMPTLWGYARLKHYPLVYFSQAPASLLRSRWWAQVWPTFIVSGFLMAGGFLIYRWIVRRQTAAQALVDISTAQLARSARAMRDAQQMAKVGSWELELASGALHWSDEIFRIFEIDPDRFGATYAAFLEVVHPDDREAVNAAYADSLADHQPYEITHRLKMADGRIKHVQERCESEFDADGKPLRSVGTVQDITAQWLAEARVRDALAEKEVLLKEIYHRVKNNLQVVASLLNLQGRGADDAGTRALLADSANRVKSMALVHEQLYRSQDLSNIALGEYLAQLAAHLQEAHRPLSARVPLRLEVDDVPLGIETAVPLGLIVNELVSNAYKHGYAADTQRGQIVLHAQRIEDGRLRMRVSDDGRGLPAGFDPQASTTLGMQLLVTLTGQLDGALGYGSGPGCWFEIVFRPDTAEAQRLGA